MNDEAYLIINKRGVVSLKKNKPQLKGDQIAILLKLKVPDRLFKKFVPEALLTISEENVIPPDIQVDLQQAPEETQVIEAAIPEREQ